MRNLIIFLAAVGMASILAGCDPEPISMAAAKAQPVPSGVEPKANAILYRASEYLKQAQTFQFRAEITRDIITYDDLRIQYEGVSKVTVQRPDKLRTIFRSDERARDCIFDGKTLTIYSPQSSMYAQKELPGTIGDALDRLFERFGYAVPLADLVYADPYAVLIENVDEGYYVGRHKVHGVPCEHLAFQQELIDWQIWIQVGKPLVRKVVVTYKSVDGVPEYTAWLSDWKLNVSVSKSDFVFQPPKDAEEIEFLPTQKINPKAMETEVVEEEIEVNES